MEIKVLGKTAFAAAVRHLLEDAESLIGNTVFLRDGYFVDVYPAEYHEEDEYGCYVFINSVCYGVYPVVYTPDGRGASVI